MTLPYAVNRGVRIWYEIHGRKEAVQTVLFLSGAGGDLTLWQSQLTAMASEFRLIALDHRGSGKSDRPDGPYSAEMMAGDLFAVLRQEGITSTVLVGFSMGGLIAQKFFSLHPDMVSHLVLMNCSLGSGNPDTVLPDSQVINMFLYYPALTLEDCCRNTVDYLFGPDLEQENPKKYKEFLDYSSNNNQGIPFQIPILMSEETFLDIEAARRIPVMVILSSSDPVTPPENGEAFKKHLPHAEIEYLDGHHASMLIHPDETTRLLRDFLSTSREQPS
jgi:pimeloyl-ACP methyl ester carboxylesterase